MKRLTNLLLALIFFASLLSENKTYASPQIMGSDLTWKCIGRDSFLVMLTVYMDCNGTSLSSPSPINFQCASNGDSITSVITHAGNPMDITPTCKGGCTRCQSLGCSFPYGISRYTLLNLVVLSSAGSCCDILISWQMCCRNQAITTGSAGENFYTSATLNRCINPCANSMSFSSPPLAILCVGQPFTYDGGVTDDNLGKSGGLLDSLTFEMTSPLQAKNSPTTYTGSYTYDEPINFWGFPNATLPFPRGFHTDYFDYIQFQPMQVEITVMTQHAKQYRNGILIGQLRREMQFIVINCPTDHPPTIATPDNIAYKEVCAGSSVTYNFSTDDQDYPDTVTISWNNTIPGAQWTNTNGLTKHPTGTLTWTPDDRYVSSIPYSFTVTARDDACPIRGSYTQTYQILVKPRPRANITIADSGNKLFYFIAIPVVGKSPSYLWQGSNIKDTFTLVGRIVHHQFKRRGFYPIAMTMTAGGCSNTYYDTILVDSSVTDIKTNSNNSLNDELIVYPNPTASSDKLIIETKNSIYNQLALYDIIGQKVKEITIIPNEKNILNIIDIKPGIYFLRAQQTQTGAFICKKIIISK